MMPSWAGPATFFAAAATLVLRLRAPRAETTKPLAFSFRGLSIWILMKKMLADWRDSVAQNGDRPAWLGEVVDELGHDIMSGINSAAAVTPISLLAYVLLATPKQKIGSRRRRTQ